MARAGKPFFAAQSNAKAFFSLTTTTCHKTNTVCSEMCEECENNNEDGEGTKVSRLIWEEEEEQ